MTKLSKKASKELTSLVNSIECYYIIMEGLKDKKYNGDINEYEYWGKWEELRKRYNRDVTKLNEMFGTNVTTR